MGKVLAHFLMAWATLTAFVCVAFPLIVTGMAGVILEDASDGSPSDHNSRVMTADAGNVDLSDRLAACAACHGKNGEGAQGSEYYPHLAGKPAGYLFEQLRGFRDGRRINATMTWFVQFVDDSYLREIAEHYSRESPRMRAADTAADVLTDERRAIAEKLVEHGDPARGVPACMECHGQPLTGLEPGIPALLGLPADYVVAQFGSWRDGVRHGAPPDCMHDVATAIAVEDIRAVASWLSQQSNVEGVGPAPSGSFVPPEACGSLPHKDVLP